MEFLNIVLYILCQTVELFLFVLMLAFLVRMLMSLFMGEDSVFGNLLLRLTEPFVMPVRSLFSRMGLEEGPLDISFLVTVLLISLIQATLPGFTI